MDLSGLGAGIFPGYIQGQEKLAQAALLQQAEQDQKAQLAGRAAAARWAAAGQGGQGQPGQQGGLGGLAQPGGLGGLSTAPPPPPQGPGQASVPMQPGPPPGAAPPPPQGAPPPGGMPPGANPPPPQGAPPGPPPGAAARPAPPPGPPAGGQQAGPPPSPMVQQAQSQISQLAQQIMKANPNLDTKSTDGALALFSAIQQSQVLQDPMAKEYVAAMKQTLAERSADQKYETAIQKINEDAFVKLKAAETREQVATISAVAANARAQAAIDARSQEGDKNRGSREKIAGDNAASREKISEEKLKSIATKAQAGDIDDSEAKYYARALKTDPAMVLRMMGAGNAGSAAKRRIAKAFAEDPENTPEDLAKAEIVLSGKKSGMQTAERQGAKVDIGAEEIKTFGPKVVAAAKAVNPTKYPTWNSLQQAAQRGTGGPEVVALNDAITNYRNALIQVAQRGGATSEGAQARADKYLSANMSLPQILAAIQSGQVEAEVAQGAVKTVTGNIAGSVGAKPGAAPTGGAAEDPLGIR